MGQCMVVVLALFAAGQGPDSAVAGEPPGDRPRSIVAAYVTSFDSPQGKEVVIEPDPEKLGALGLTVEEFSREVEGRRFFENRWTKRIGDKELDVSTVATITIRELQAPPFEVELPDGRRATITPDPKRVAEYYVTGQFFERHVRRELADPFLSEPNPLSVLAGLPPIGREPHFNMGPGERGITIGEPLETFAKVEVHGNPGPQAADLARMRKVRRYLWAALRLPVQGLESDVLAEVREDSHSSEKRPLSRTEFEKRFGQGKKRDSGDSPSWRYSLDNGSLQVFFSDDKVFRVFGSAKAPEPTWPSPDVGLQARNLADAERALLKAFLVTLARDCTPEQHSSLAKFMRHTAGDLEWTAEEYAEVLGKDHK